MPKEQSRLTDHSPGPSSSKNAKDKSNSTILMAIRDTKEADDSNRRGSSCSSEKDSGYSDGSDWQHTDVEDQRLNRLREPGQSFQTQNKETGLKTSSMTPAKANPSPVYTIKDTQPSIIQKRSQALCTNSVRLKNPSGSPHMIFLEQPRFLQTPYDAQQPSSSGKKPNVALKAKAYPTVSPHPGKKPPDKSDSNQEYQNLSKRMCTEHRQDEPPEPRLPEQFRSPSVTSPALALDGSTSSSPTTSNENISGGARHRRFLNTVDILQQSGMLDIAMRTKELQRQSNDTELEISELRRHTELLCQAASNPNLSLNGTPAWEHLLQVMAESGNYPNLKRPQELHLPDEPEPLRTPPSRLLASTTEQSHTNEEAKAMDESPNRVAFISPDSSTD